LFTEGLLKNLFIAGREFLEELHEGDVVLLADLQNLDVLALVLFWRIVTEKNKIILLQKFSELGTKYQSNAVTMMLIFAMGIVTMQSK